MNLLSKLRKVTKLPWRKVMAVFYVAYSVIMPLAYIDGVVLAAGEFCVAGGSCYDSMQLAINAAVPGDTINLMSDVTLTSRADINKDITFNGNGYTVFASFDKTSNSNNAALGVFGNGVTIQNLIVDGTGSKPWPLQLHGINTYEATNVYISNVTVKNFSGSGIVVNNSHVTVNNITTLANGWHGINVDRKPASLTVNGTSTHTDALPIYIDNSADLNNGITITDTNSQYVSSIVGGVVTFSLADKTAPVISNPHMYVSYDGGLTYAEEAFVRAGDFVRVEVDATDDVAIDYVIFRIKDAFGGGYIATSNVSAPISGDTFRYEFQIPVDAKYGNTHMPITDLLNGQVFWARAVDTSGNYNHGNSEYFTFDRGIPTVSAPTMSVSYDGGATYMVKNVVKPGDMVRIETEATDALSGVDYVEFRVQNGTTGEYITALAKKYTAVSGDTYRYDFTMPADGKYVNTHNPVTFGLNEQTAWVRSYDVVGNYVHGQSITFTIDNVAPVAMITSHTDGELVNETITVSGLVTDDNLSHYWFVIKNDVGTIVAGPGKVVSTAPVTPTIVWNTASVSDGVYTVTLSSRDLADNKDSGSTDVINLFIDNTPPYSTFSAPSSNTFYKETGLPVSVIGESIDDSVAVAFVEISVSEAGADTWTLLSKEVNISLDNPYFWNYDWSPTVEGVYDFKVVATDIAGNIESTDYVYDVTYDATNPTVAITSPSLDSYHKDSVDVIGTASDTLSGIKEVMVKFVKDSTGTICEVDESEWSLADFNSGDNTWSFSLPKDSCADGYYEVIAKAWDNSGNTKRTISHVYIDTTAPATPTWGTVYNRETSEEIGCGAYTNETKLDFEWNQNLENDLAGYYFGTSTNDHQSYFTAPDNYKSANLNASKSTFFYTVIAVDLAGNESEISDQCDIILDQENPIISEVLVDETEVEGTLNYGEGDIFPSVTVTATDNEMLAGICFSIQGPESMEYDLFNFTDIFGDMCFTIDESVDNGWGTGTDTEFTWSLNDAIEQELEGFMYFDTALLHEGEYTFTYEVTDMAGNVSETAETVVNLDNVKPTLTFGSDQLIIEGSDAVFTGSFLDPSFIEDYGPGYEPTPLGLQNFEGMPADDSNWSAYIDYGDSSQVLYKDFLAPGDIDFPAYTYTYNGEYTVTAMICESEYTPMVDFAPAAFQVLEASTLELAVPFQLGEGQCDVQTATVTVSDLTPTVSITAAPDGDVETGASVELVANPVGGNAPYTHVWSGDCSGTDATATVDASVDGAYSCTVTTTDVDGDVTTAVYSFTAATTPEPFVPVAFVPVVLAGDQGGEIAGVQDATEEEGEVKGETCEDVKLSGYVYVDDNKNDSKDEDEKALEGAVVLLTDKDGKVVEEVTADENGYWEASVCADDYTITIDEDSVDSKYDVKGVKTEVELDGSDTEVGLDLAVETTGKTLMDYWWVLLLLLLLPLGYYGFTKFKNSRE
jgi:hypothetical protein